MVQYLKWFFNFSNLLFLIIGINGCSNDPTTPTTQTAKDSISNCNLKLIVKKRQYQIQEEFNAEENKFLNNSLGIHASLRLDIPKAFIDSVKKLGYDGIYVNFICLNNEEIRAQSLDYLQIVNKIHEDKDEFISTPKICKIEYTFAYKDLEMVPGQHPLFIGYQLLGVHFQKNKSEVKEALKSIKKIDTISLASSLYHTIAKCPYLHKVSITVKKFQLEIAKHDIHNYDFSLGGSGKPDLYWDVFCGERRTYCAPQIKNTHVYHKQLTSDTFYCSDQDIISINFSDYDNGPFNTQDDVIACWKGKIADLKLRKTDTLRYERITYAILTAKVSE